MRFRPAMDSWSITLFPIRIRCKMIECNYGEASNIPLYKFLIASFPLPTDSVFPNVYKAILSVNEMNASKFRWL
jgi:hypothetical protein